MEKIKHYEVGGDEKEKLHKKLFIPQNKSIYKVKFISKIPFNFIYTSLNSDFEKELEKILNKDFTKPNAFLYAKENFTLALAHLLTMFSSPKDLPCFSGNYSIDIFLAKDFEEFCLIGNSKKLNLPSFAKGRVHGTTLIYIQDSFLNNSKKEISKRSIFGNAHELLHIFFHYNNFNEYGNTNYASPFLLVEGLTVICANQISKDFKEGFISAEHLFLKNNINVFKYDKRWITENKYYQSAGQFMDYLLKRISEKDKISYKKAFQKIFSTIGCPESFDKQKRFSAEKYFKNIFNLDIKKEYYSFLNS